jgi:uncharacterized phage protein (TIGR01671 family)
MNREIKFRIWDRQQRKFHTDADWGISLRGNHIIGFSSHDSWNDDRGYKINLSNQDNLIVQQYTGLKDSKGVEIYEGDICNAGIVIGDVGYSIGGFYLASNPLMEYFKGYPDNMNVLSPDWDCSWIDVEIIGNIMQNPEILEH